MGKIPLAEREARAALAAEVAPAVDATASGHGTDGCFTGRMCADTSMLDMHLRLKINGPQEKIDFFNFCMLKMDGDWPYAEPAYRQTKKIVWRCSKCNGLLWRNPNINAEHIRRLVWQINNMMPDLPGGKLKVTVKVLTKAKACFKAGAELIAVHPPSCRPGQLNHLPSPLVAPPLPKDTPLIVQAVAASGGSESD